MTDRHFDINAYKYFFRPIFIEKNELSQGFRFKGTSNNQYFLDALRTWKSRQKGGKAGKLYIGYWRDVENYWILREIHATTAT